MTKLAQCGASYIERERQRERQKERERERERETDRKREREREREREKGSACVVVTSGPVSASNIFCSTAGAIVSLSCFVFSCRVNASDASSRSLQHTRGVA
jgi:hypothetical protein